MLWSYSLKFKNMYSISSRVNQLHNDSCSHLSLCHVQKPPIYLRCSSNVYSPLSFLLGSNFQHSTLIVYSIHPFILFHFFVSTYKEYSIILCMLLLLVSQSTEAPSCLSNVHRWTLRVPCYPIQSPRYLLLIQTKQNLLLPLK